MTADELVHNRVALILGDALIRKVALETEIEALRQQLSAKNDELAAKTLNNAKVNKDV